MDLGLKNKKVIVAGGSRGIGRAALEIFASEGADVAFFSRSGDQVAETRQALKRFGGKVFGERYDVDDIEAYKAFLSDLADKLGGADVFVHNISSSGSGKTSDWTLTHKIDVLGAVAAVEALSPVMERGGGGSIVFMSSTAAVETFLSASAFNALKAALVTYGKQLSQVLGPKGIRVNCVSPGPTIFEGGNWDKIKAARPELYEATKAKAVLGRLGSAEEIAKTVVFLASEAASYTTGVNVVVDGGYTKRVQL